MQKYDWVEDPKPRNLPRKELEVLLKAANLSTKGKIDDLRHRAKNNNPPIEIKKVCGKPMEGYVNKPLGLLELLFRRGFIDTTKPLPTKNDLLNICKKIPDFMNEKSEIEQAMQKLDVDVIFTPKAHCEMAGRGIEYIWGIGKVDFRKQNSKLTTQQRVDTLNERVKRSIESIPKKTYRKCCRKTREYKLSYRKLNEMKEGDDKSLKLADIEKMKREYKAKRSALEQDKGFVTSCFDLMKSEIKCEKGKKFEFKREPFHDLCQNV